MELLDGALKHTTPDVCGIGVRRLNDIINSGHKNLLSIFSLISFSVGLEMLSRALCDPPQLIKSSWEDLRLHMKYQIKERCPSTEFDQMPLSLEELIASFEWLQEASQGQQQRSVLKI